MAERSLPLIHSPSLEHCLQNSHDDGDANGCQADIVLASLQHRPLRHYHCSVLAWRPGNPVHGINRQHGVGGKLASHHVGRHKPACMKQYRAVWRKCRTQTLQLQNGICVCSVKSQLHSL